MFCLLLICGFGIGWSNAQTVNRGRLFVVNSVGDSIDVNPGDGFCLDAELQCTLRAAILEANTTSAFDAISFALSYPSKITLTLDELRVIRPLAIVGPGARRLTIERSAVAGTPNFRIFNLARNGFNTHSIRGVGIRNGNCSFGCGIYVDLDTTANLVDISVTNNSGALGGGVGNAGTVNLTRSLVASNVTTHQGGGFINLGFGSIALITDSTITGNTSASGGGLYNNGRMLLINDTISHNVATTQASSIDNSFDPASIVSILNTIVGNDSLAVNSFSGAFSSLGNNIITDARGSTGFIDGLNNDQVSNNNEINPLLGDLSNNGGETDTRALLTNSLAINRGNNCIHTGNCSLPNNQNVRLVSDQRSRFGRLVGQNVDIGAFEAGASQSTGFTIYGGRLPGGASRFQGALLALTNARSGDKVLSPVNPIGNFRLNNLSLDDTYILEIYNKRRAFFDPVIITFDGIP